MNEIRITRGSTLSVLFVLLLVGVTGSMTPSPGRDSYRRAQPGYKWTFPADHGSHPEYRTEWWYLTGVLESDRRRFGYQFTLFRNGLTGAVELKNPWLTDQVYLAHLGLSDVGRETHRARALLSRGNPHLARADTTMPGKAFLRGWKLTIGDTWRVRAGDTQAGYDLVLKPTRPPLFQGPGGYSRKGPGPGQASQYYSLTRMLTSGRLWKHGTEFSVRGWTWFDHEFGTSQLNENQVGWDWLSLRLENGTDIMVYRLREKDGSVTPQSSATVRTPGGAVRHFLADEWSFTPVPDGRTWTSPKTGARYPLEWRLELPARDLELRVRARFPEQEMVLREGGTTAYWEGVIRAEGSRQGQEVDGRGFLELTGYAGSLQGRF